MVPTTTLLLLFLCECSNRRTGDLSSSVRYLYSKKRDAFLRRKLFCLFHYFLFSYFPAIIFETKKSLHQKEDATTTTTTTECVLPTPPPPNTRRRVSDHHHRPPPKKESHYARRRLVSVFSLEQKSVALKRDLLLRRRDID